MTKIAEVYYAKDIAEQLYKAKQIAIFSARIVAIEVAFCLMEKPYCLNISCFIVSQTEDNPHELLGKEVISLEAAKKKLVSDVLIIIASMERNLFSIYNCLHNAGFYHLLPLTFESDLWSEIRGNYFMEYYKKNQKNYLILEKEIAQETTKKDISSICIYTAKCHLDKNLKEDISRFFWEIPIQVGSALTEKRICAVQDNTGENISIKNKQYCELTALYWIWKNTSSVYAGLCHYRRHFELNYQILSQLLNSDIDIVLTIPILNFPSVKSVYYHDHIGEDWEIMMKGIKIICPDYLDSAKIIQDGIYYYGYNMFIARKEILDTYCTWLFPILKYCEQTCKEKEDRYQGRYLGFLAERLFTIFIKHHENQFKIVHAKKHFIMD